jgi:hypothetical protein
VLCSIFKKPTAIAVIISYHSCHHPEHKNLPVKVLVNRVQNYPTSEGRRNEMTMTNHILNNNEYSHDYHKTVHRDHKNNINVGGKKNWITFTYRGKETRNIAKLFKNSNIRVVLRTNNMIQKNLHIRTQKPDRYNNSSIH